MRLTDAAFEGAVERYGDTVFRLAYSYLKNRADAEDVMQETLLKLYLERKPFRSPEHERYWVVRVAVNESKKLLRSPWRRRTGLWRRPGSPVFDTPQQSELYQHVMGLPAQIPGRGVSLLLRRLLRTGDRGGHGGQSVHRADLAHAGQGEAETDLTGGRVMIDKRLYQETFSHLRASDQAKQEVFQKMQEMKHRKRMPRVLRARPLPLPW